MHPAASISKSQEASLILALLAVPLECLYSHLVRKATERQLVHAVAVCAEAEVMDEREQRLSDAD